MTTFSTADRTRIVKALKLDRRQDQSSSTLASLMRIVESDDTQNDTDYTGDIIDLLNAIDELKDVITEQSGASGILAISVYQEVSVQYANATSATSVSKGSMQGHVDQIWLWLDPNGELERFKTGGQVIATL